MNRKWNGRTPLEEIGSAMRAYNTMNNEWGKDRQYTKILVSAEYKVQQEFPVN